MEKKAILDRIEDGQVAVLLVDYYEEEWNVSATLLPKDSQEGASLLVTIENQKIIHIQLDEAAQYISKERITKKMSQLKKQTKSKFKKK
ncbi:DUF3006 domain-containing protein [Alkalihalobacillus trypoxylicola]|uniref:Uncharacterized protein n=1 Tax=Alkalihalobacillus trypoxylicola TaxID=519424 RepID=A0A161PD81_9BACI|nr:DUF3006 domain-containing protein [Alkalihalobacillus trypoxylicola]KYG30747.1 hypothetical protein AZF04_18845 [Alkalihalobacillus trypoxylicola]